MKIFYEKYLFNMYILIAIIVTEERRRMNHNLSFFCRIYNRKYLHIFQYSSHSIPKSNCLNSEHISLVYERHLLKHSALHSEVSWMISKFLKYYVF